MTTKTNPRYFMLRTPTEVKVFAARSVMHAHYCLDEALGTCDYRATVTEVSGDTTTYRQVREGKDTGTTLSIVHASGLDKEAALDALQACIPHFSAEGLQFMLSRSMMPPMPTDDASEAVLIAYLAD